MSTTVTDAPDASRYEIRVDGELAGIAEYRLSGGTITFHHTQVESEYEGRGLARTMVTHALDEARVRGLAVVPQCPFVRMVVARSPREYLDLVPADARVRLDLPSDVP